MKQFLVCSECGLTSGRKGNVLRHISSQHSGQGAVLGLMQYLLKSLQGELPMPTYHRPAGQFDLVDSPIAPKQPVDILLDHASTGTQKAVELVSRFDSEQVVILGVDVCEKCLVYRYFWNGKSTTIPDKTDHECDLHWILNNPHPFQKEIAVELLKKHTISQLASLLNTLCGGRPELIAIPPPNATQRRIAKEVANVVASRLIREGKPFEAFVHEALISPKSSQTKLPPLSHNQSDLVYRACSNGRITLSEEDLLEFLAITQTTFAEAIIGDDRYHFYIPVQKS
jgi:hypothetical protein